MKFLRQFIPHVLIFSLIFDARLVANLAHAEATVPVAKTPAQDFSDKITPDFVKKFMKSEGPGLAQEWDKSIVQSLDAQLAALTGGESDATKTQNFLNSIEALRVSAFAQGSAHPNSRYFYNHPLDTWQLLGQNVVLKGNDKPQVPVVNPKKLYLEVINEESEVVHRISPAEKYIAVDGGTVTGGVLSKAFGYADIRNAKPNQTFRFRLTYQDKVLHVFENNIVSAQFIGKYLVFVDPSRINKLENTLNLSFIDLEFFQDALGKTVLPVFRLPLKVEDANLLEVPENIKIHADGSTLKVLDKQLTTKVFSVFANVQRPLYNQSVSLVDPNYYETVAPIVGELTTEFENAARSASEYSQQEFDRAGVNKEVMNGFISTLRQEANLRAATGPKVEDPKSEGPHAQLTNELERLQIENLSEIDAIIVENIDNPDLWPEGTEKKALLTMSEDEKTALRQRALDVLHDKISKNVLANIAKTKHLADELMTDELVQKSIGKITPALVAQRKLLARIHMLWLRLTMPQPLGAPKIQEALAIVAAGVSAKNSWATPGLQWTDLTKEGLARFFANRKVRVATPILVGALLGLGYPAEFSQFMYGSLDVIQQIGNATLGKADDLWQLTKEAVEVSFEWLKPTQIYERYLKAEQMPKLMTGVGAVGAFLGTFFGTLHTAANSASYIKSLRGGLWSEARAKSDSWLGAVKNSFIMHMDRDKKTYYQVLAKAEEEKLQRDAKKAAAALAKGATPIAETEKLQGTPEEDVEAARIVEAIREKDQRFSRMFEAMRNWPIFRSIFGKSENGIDTFTKAFTHFIVGYSTWTHSTYLFGQMWNPWFISRNFWYRPRAVLTMLVYPNYFNRSIWGPDKPESMNGLTPEQYLELEKGSHFPTEYNGGKRPIYKTLIFHRWFGSEETKKRLDELKEFEKGIMPVEAELYKASMRAAYTHMFSVAGQDPEVIDFLRKGAIESPTDPRISKMSSRLQYYFRAYFTKTFELSMQTALKQAVGNETLSDEDGDLKDLAVAARADQTLKTQLTGADAVKSANAIVQQVLYSGEVEKYADNAANNFIGGMWERVKLSQNRKVAAALDPIKNGSLNRFKVASFQMERPEAMARATRAFMVSMITDKPMELMFLMLFGVGITSGVMAPLQDEMFSENSWFHMSRYLVWNGFISGILISFLADVWMKIQMDYRMDKQNAFDNVPEGADAQRGWWGWLWKQSWTKQNTWWDNYTYLLKLSFINMPAYFLTALVINFSTMGRFDLDSFLNVYILALLPMSGLHSKFASAFEAATDWVIRDVPKKFRAHPLVREYRSQASNKKRITFNLLYNFILNIEYNVLGNLSTMATAALGPRAFSRWVFGGYTPTELVVMKGLRPVGDALGGIAKSITNACEPLLTTNYTDGVKITPRSK